MANGRVIHRAKPEGFVKNFTLETAVNKENYSWVAARSFLKPEGTIRFAHSSPVYLAGKWDASADARHFVAWIDDLLASSDSDPNRFATDAEKQEILTLYREARQFYAARIH